MAGTTAAQQAMFPELTARTLEGKMVTLPGEFPGELNLVLVTFEHDHQREADTWLDAAPELFKKYPDIPCFEVAVTGKEYTVGRFLLDRAMRSEIPNHERWARTVTVYINKIPFEQSLQIKNEERTVVLLVDRKGTVLWREEGIYHDLKGNSLRAKLASLRPPAQ
jgi:hypothetical protein